MTASRIWLIRHGETEWSRDGRHTGRTDLPLTPRGEALADALRPELAGVQPGLVLCSPLARARETARRAGLAPDDVIPDLLEWDYGAWEGRTTAEIRTEQADPSWVIWDHPIPPGRTPGEQLTDVGRRVARVIERCRPGARRRPGLRPGRPRSRPAHPDGRLAGPSAGRRSALRPRSRPAVRPGLRARAAASSRCWNASSMTEPPRSVDRRAFDRMAPCSTTRPDAC